MPPDPRGQEDARKVAQALKRKIREKALTYQQVEERAGMGRDYLRQVLRGTLKLRVEHVAAVLSALDIPPIEFYVEVYGAPRAPLYAREPPEDQGLRTTVGVVHRSLLRRTISKLKEKGIFTSDEADGMLAELEQTMRPAEAPL
ncbi:MAG TPA: helix-turn-helix transcriptional regulator [Thermoanaerobaculia bacterium]|nr:helix-turn-helix transcriptional regulator [Thermoanaerobaculia bacterium]